MGDGSLYYRLASNGFIDSYLNNNNIDGIIEDCANKELIMELTSRDNGIGKDMIKEGLGQGIKSYLLDILDTYVTVSDTRALDHISNTDSFSERIYQSLCDHSLIKEPSAGVTNESLANALFLLSEYSEAMAESFMAYVHNNIVSPRIKRIY